MKIIAFLCLLMFSQQALSYEAKISCSTADFECHESLCGWWMNPVPIDKQPTLVKLEPNPWRPNSWIGKYAEQHNGYAATVTIMFQLNDQTSSFEFYNSIELMKDSHIAESYGYSSSTSEHVDISLRAADKTGVRFMCMINLVKQP